MPHYVLTSFFNFFSSPVVIEPQLNLIIFDLAIIDIYIYGYNQNQQSIYLWVVLHINNWLCLSKLFMQPKSFMSLRD